MNRIPLLCLAALAFAQFAAARTLKVVTTTADLASIVLAVGGNKVSVSSLIVGARDPHRIEAKPSYMSRVGSADLFVAVGLELEVGYERAILDGSSNSNVAIGARGHLYAADFAVILEKPTSQVSRAAGDVHPYGNPHFWLDPFNVRLIAVGLANKMGQLDPEDAAYFKSNAQKFNAQIDESMFGSAVLQKFGASKLWEWSKNGGFLKNAQANGAAGMIGGWEAKLARYSGSPIITYHRSWSYLANRFGLRVAAELEPKPGLDPTPGHIASVIKTGSQDGVRAIIQEPFYPTRDAQFVAQRIGAKVVVVPNSVGQVPEAKGYLSLMDTLVNRLSAALGG